MKNKRIYVAGHNGMVGSAVVRKLKAIGCNHIITRNRSELDLTDQGAVSNFFKNEKINYVILAAAKVGGIHANNVYPADFIYQNLMIEANVIHNSYRSNVERLLFLGSSCIYPRDAEQPMSEGALLTGRLEPTNEPYAIAKIAGIKLCESYNRQHNTDFRSVMPTNLYGPGDNFHLENSHVIPALIRRFHEAKINDASSVTIWGTGNPYREFLFVDDMADASIYVLGLKKAKYDSIVEPTTSHINVGSGVDLTIKELAKKIAKTISFNGGIIFDTTKPDGAPRKLMNIKRLASIGWKCSVGIEDGLKCTYEWYLKNAFYKKRI